MNITTIIGALALLGFLGYVAYWRFIGTEANRMGEVVYSDTKGAKLIKHRAGVRGRPDAIVKHKPVLFGKEEHRPFEIKTTRLRGKTPEPPLKHVIQLAAEGLLVEKMYGAYPSHGYLQYTGQITYTVKLGPRMRELVIDTIDAMRHRSPERRKARGGFKCGPCRRLGECPVRDGLSASRNKGLF